MNLVVAVFTRGAWRWLRVDVAPTNSATMLELGDREQATVWKSGERDVATRYANLVKGIVIRADWKPPSGRDRMGQRT